MRRLVHWLLLTLAAIFVVAGIWHGIARSGQSPQITGSGSAALGLVLLNDDGCVYVLAVSDQSPAYHAGLEPGDYILRAGETTVEDFNVLNELIEAEQSSLRLTIRREGEERMVVLPCKIN